MRYKVVPPVRSTGFLEDVAAALPLVPGSVEDCCTRIRDRTAVPARDEAREYLTFVRALGLAREASEGFHRTGATPEEETLARAYEERIFGVREVVSLLATGPKSADAVFAAIRPELPTWERRRTQDVDGTWRERTDRLLGWGVEFGLFARSAGEYRLTARGRTD